MALATRCPFCQTTFRVAQDQLKLRGGLVRCGSCREVFDGNDHLVSPNVARQLVASPPTAANSQRPVPTGWPPLPGQRLRPPVSQEPPTQSEAVSAAPPQTPSTDIAATFASIAAATSDAPWGLQAISPAAARPEPVTAGTISPSRPPLTELPHQAPLAKTGSAVVQAEAGINTLTQQLAYPTQLTSADAQENPSQVLTAQSDSDTGAGQSVFTSDAVARTNAAVIEVCPAEDRGENDGPDPVVPEESVLAEEEQGEEGDADDTPAFVQNAERRERRRRISRIVMGITAGVLSVTLALQAIYIWRNVIAAWLPPAQPILSKVCMALHCSVGLPTNIDQLVLESSELQLVPPNQNIYSLSVLLRNRSYGSQAWPYLELTLNDADEKAVMRRIFTPREYLDATHPIAGGLSGEGEQQIRLTFELAQPAASGYRIYLFYP